MKDGIYILKISFIRLKQMETYNVHRKKTNVIKMSIPKLSHTVSVNTQLGVLSNLINSF